MDDKIIKKLRDTQIEILDKVHSFCDDNNIKYYLYAGTLLGAVRHKGFIPWDDDLDIIMPRKDYDRFIKLFMKSDLLNNYFLQNTDTEPEYHLPFTKIRKKNTLYSEKGLEELDINHGIFIDIFPMDFSKKNYGFVYKTRDLLEKNLVHVAGMRQLKIKTVSMFSSILYAATRIMSVHRILKIAEWLCKAVKKGDYYVIFSSYFNCEKETVPVEYYNNPVLLRFDGKQYYAPGEYHKILEIKYGNYMELPPENERENHEVSNILFDVEKGE